MIGRTMPIRRSSLRGLAIAGLLTLACAVPARADIGGRLNYTGSLGPVGPRRPLCICVFTDAALTHSLGCVIVTANDLTYTISTTTHTDVDYYLIAFLDLHVNERHDADEPYEIFHDRADPPADPVVPGANRTDIDFVFGDENLAAATATVTAATEDTPTAAPTDSAAPSPSAVPTVTAADTPTGTPPPSATTPTPPPALGGDCNGDGLVTIDDLVRAVAVALGTANVSTCPAADLDGNGIVTIAELIAAVRAALVDQI
jgi:hypothetical protein